MNTIAQLFDKKRRMTRLWLVLIVGFTLELCVLGQDQGQNQNQIDLLLPQDTTQVKIDTLSYWKSGNNFGFNLQQVGLTNWAAGGESSVAIGTKIESFANYEKLGKVWQNRLKISYGLIRNGDARNRFVKTDDQVLLSSKYSQKFSEKILLTTSINFQTQMDEGYRTQKIAGTDQTKRILISNFMSPGYLLASLGISYREGDVLTATLAPFTGRFTFVLSDTLSNLGAFGINPGDQIRPEAGISFTGSYKKMIWDNVTFLGNFNLFANYETFPNTVINLETVFNLKVNDYLSSNISSQLIYDDDIKITRNDGTRGRDVQIKNVINVGVTLSF
ncbi:MAG: hypothetical protein ACI905_001516 [Roseivirga sp.]